MKRNLKSGFTLIELLVVVLVIGILSSIAVPQYFKVVEKSRVAEATGALAAIRASADRYYANTNSWPVYFSHLDLVYRNSAGSMITQTAAAALKFFTVTLSGGTAYANRTNAPYFTSYRITMNYQTGILSIGPTTSGQDSLLPQVK